MIEKTKRSIQWVTSEKNKLKYAGIHLIAEFWRGKAIEDEKRLKKILIGAAKASNSTPLSVDIKKFLPQGITGVVLLAESHISIHSWPEYDYLAMDIFTCGDKSMPDKALDYLRKEFKPERVEVKKIKRGMI